MTIARSLDAYPESAGNLAVLALVDSSAPEIGFCFEGAFGALTHFGIPFRVALEVRGLPWGVEGDAAGAVALVER